MIPTWFTIVYATNGKTVRVMAHRSILSWLRYRIFTNPSSLARYAKHTRPAHSYQTSFIEVTHTRNEYT